MSLETRANRAKRRLMKQLGTEDGLIGLGIQERAPDCLEIVAHVSSEGCAVRKRIPMEWEGFPVRVIVTGLPSKKD
jgi:hypothetical protein